MTTHDPSHYSDRLGEFILLRLLAAGKAPTKSTFDKQMRAYFAEPVAMPAAQWNDLLDRAILALHSAGRIKVSPFCLTDEGHAHVLRVLSIPSTPTNIRWQTLRNRFLVAKALEITPRSKAEWTRLGTADGLRAAILTRHYRLPLGPVPTVAQALNALAWFQLKEGHELAIPCGKRFTRKAVLCATLLGDRPSDNVVKGLAALVTGATSSLPDRVREALIGDWIHRKRSDPVDTDHFDLPAFANKVGELARNTSSGRYGAHKVFISHVWNRFSQECSARGMTRDEFDRHLVEANREDLLVLTRADLISDMTPEDVHQSEICLSNSSFHFIRTDTQAI